MTVERLRELLATCRDTCPCGYEDIGEPGIPRRWFCEIPHVAAECAPVLLAVYDAAREFVTVESHAKIFAGDVGSPYRFVALAAAVRRADGEA